MAQYFSTEFAGITAQPVVKPSAPVGVGARVRRFRGTVNLASQAVITVADNISLCRIPAGYLFCYGVIVASATLGGVATLAIGITGTTGKYRAAAIFTAVDTPTFFGPALIIGNQTPTAAEEEILGTIAAASLPAAGTFVVDMYMSNG